MVVVNFCTPYSPGKLCWRTALYPLACKFGIQVNSYLMLSQLEPCAVHWSLWRCARCTVYVGYFWVLSSQN